MKAAVYTAFGLPEVLSLIDVDRPAPSQKEVLVEIHAVSVNFADWAFVRGKPIMVRLMGAGLFRPRNAVLGSDIAGKVAAVGKAVTQYRPGDEVFGDISECGWGGFAEFAAAPESALARKPPGLTFAQAAAVPQAATTALQALRDAGQIQSGQKVLINGASGGIGTFAVQIAKSFGADVTGVCSTRNVALVRSLGADRVVDYTREDFTELGEAYDLILATAGNRSIFDYRRALGPKGTYVMSGGALTQVMQAMLLGSWLSREGGHTMTYLAARTNRSDLDTVGALIDAGGVVPVIDRSYPLHGLPAALAYYGKGHARGNVVITVANET